MDALRNFLALPLWACGVWLIWLAAVVTPKRRRGDSYALLRSWIDVAS